MMRYICNFFMMLKSWQTIKRPKTLINLNLNLLTLGECKCKLKMVKLGLICSYRPGNERLVQFLLLGVVKSVSC